MFYEVTSYNDALEACKIALEAKVVPMLHGHAGIGKSALARILAELGNLVLIDIRLSTIEPELLTGYPRPNPQTNR